jgi:hypothetical protein
VLSHQNPGISNNIDNSKICELKSGKTSEQCVGAAFQFLLHEKAYGFVVEIISLKFQWGFSALFDDNSS